MGISAGCQGLSSAGELFADLKGKYVFNFLDDLVVYSPLDDHVNRVREVLKRLQMDDFTLNPNKWFLEPPT